MSATQDDAIYYTTDLKPTHEMIRSHYEYLQRTYPDETKHDRQIGMQDFYQYIYMVLGYHEKRDILDRTYDTFFTSRILAEDFINIVTTTIKDMIYSLFGYLCPLNRVRFKILRTTPYQLLGAYYAIFTDSLHWDDTKLGPFPGDFYISYYSHRIQYRT